MHEVPLIRFDPDGKIRRMLFFVLVFEIATFVEQVVHDLAGQPWPYALDAVQPDSLPYTSWVSTSFWVLK